MSTTTNYSFQVGVTDNDPVPPDEWNKLRQIADWVFYELAYHGRADGVRPESSGTTGCRINSTTKRIIAPGRGFVAGCAFYVSSSHEVSSTATGGTTGTLSDTALTEGNDEWNDAWVIFTSGLNSGEVVQVDDYDSANHLMTLADTLANPVTAGDGYTVTYHYIEDLVSNAANYIYGRVGPHTARRGICQWHATLSSTKTAGEILIAKLTLDASGSVTATSYTVLDSNGYEPDRNAYPWEVTKAAGSGTFESVPIGGTVEEYVTHDAATLLGSIVVTVDTGVTVEITETWREDQFLLTVTNGTGYLQDLDYTWHRYIHLQTPRW